MGYVALLRRLRQTEPVTVYAPRFDRALDEPIAAAIRVDPSVRYVITEGNYLLVDHGGWQGVRPLLDECWFLRPADHVRRSLLVARHVAFGRSPQAARRWVDEVDEPNAELIAATATRADLVITAASNYANVSTRTEG